jgi:hypothetical protein
MREKLGLNKTMATRQAHRSGDIESKTMTNQSRLFHMHSAIQSAAAMSQCTDDTQAICDLTVTED